MFPLDLSVSELKLDGDSQFLGIVRDLTERYAIEQRERRRLGELAHAAHLSAMGEMSSGIAHKINQPLAAIASYADALLRLQRSEQFNQATLTSSLTQIASQCSRAGEIIQQLRRMGRKATDHHASIDLNATLRDVLMC